MRSNTWLANFVSSAQRTDRFSGHADHAALLAAGLMGETGSILSEFKKVEREQQAYPAYRRRMKEELGDFLWYFVRLVCVLDEDLLTELAATADAEVEHKDSRSLPVLLDLGHAVGQVLDGIRRGVSPGERRSMLRRVWGIIHTVARQAQIGLQDAALGNTCKVESRWPIDRVYAPLFDEGFPEEEQLPRNLEVTFFERARGEHQVVFLRCNGINFGDRVTDNIEDPDGYRYHDVFHFAHAVYLGWSPVVRALLHCKRKSRPEIDEAQDGARAGILEEAVAAIVFRRAKELKFFEGRDHIDFDLLKLVKEFVHGYEVERVPLWQWEAAVLEGYRIFRELCRYRGGRVSLDLQQRRLKYSPL